MPRSRVFFITPWCRRCAGQFGAGPPKVRFL